MMSLTTLARTNSGSTIRRRPAGLAVVGALLVIALLGVGCGGPTEQGRPGLYDPPTIEADFGDADLVFGDLAARRLLWRFDHIDHDVDIYNPFVGEDNLIIGGLSPGQDPTELVVYVYDPTGVAQDKIMVLGYDGLIEIGEVEGKVCVGAGAGETETYALQIVGEIDPVRGVTGVISSFGMDADGEVMVSTEPFEFRHQYCPVFSDGHEQVAFTVPASAEDLKTAGVKLVVGSSETTWTFDSCVMIPWDFDPAGERLAVAADCYDDASRRSGLYLFDLVDAEAEPTLLIQDRIGFTTWSPDGRWIAYVTADDDYDDFPTATRLSAVEVSTGDVVLVPFPGGSFPAWILHGDELPGNWS